MTQVTATKVFLYIPNLIGYLRICLTCYSHYVAMTDWKLSAGCYVLSFVCDFFDGYFARFFNQSSSLGAVLDMVTDRCSTTGLLVILSHLYPSYLLGFICLIVLDFSSHWYHMYSTKSHHKSVEEDRIWILRIYYGFLPLFGFCCIGAEIFYVALYVAKFQPNFTFFSVPIQMVLKVCGVACFLKNIVNVAQLASAATAIAEADAIEANKKGKAKSK